MAEIGESVMNYQQFIAAHHITMTAERTDANPNMQSDNMDHWRVVLRIGRRSMTTYFSMGYGHGGRQPTTGDVLESLASDARSIWSTQDFEDWAGDLGYNTDSRMAERTWQTINRESKRLQRFLGVEGHRALIEDVEDDDYDS